jgi:hypothetical protein
VAFTEKRERNGRTYYYRTVSVREGDKVRKVRKYLGTDLSLEDLTDAEREADIELGILEVLLTTGEIAFLEKLQHTYTDQPTSSRENRYEAFVSMFTHDSTAIEGNTLTLQETASLLFEGITPGKSLREVNEVVNHKKAFDHLLEYDGDLTRALILHLHRLVVKDTLDADLEDQVGAYRGVQVYIRGVEWVPTSPEDVPTGTGSTLWCWRSTSTWVSRRSIHSLTGTEGLEGYS